MATGKSLSAAEKHLDEAAKGIAQTALDNSKTLKEAGASVSATAKEMIALEKQKAIDAKTYANNLKTTAAAQGVSVSVLESAIKEQNLVFDKATNALVAYADSEQKRIEDEKTAKQKAFDARIKAQQEEIQDIIALKNSIFSMNSAGEKSFDAIKKDFTDFGEAANELTGGLLGAILPIGQGMEKLQAAMTVVTTPLKLFNSAIVETAGFFGKEFNPGQTMVDWWQGTEEEIMEAGEKGKTGFQGVLNAGFDKFVESGKALGQKLGEFADRSPQENLESAKESLMAFPANLKKGVVGLGRGIASAGGAMLRGGMALLSGVATFAVNAAIFVGGLIAAGVSMLVAGLAAAAPALLIAAGIALVVGAAILLYQNFESIKETVTGKITEIVDKVKGIFSNIVDRVKGIGQMVSDWIREKVLDLKWWLPGGLSAEEQKEYDEIQARKEERKNGNKKEEKILKEANEINEESLKNKENISEEEKKKVALESEQQARTNAAKEEPSLKDLRQDASFKQAKFDRLAGVQERKDAAIAEEMRKYDAGELGDEVPEQFRNLSREDYLKSMQMYGDKTFGTDEQIEADKNQAMADLTDAEFAVSNKKEEMSKSGEMEASEALSFVEIREAKKKAHRESLGMSEEEYAEMYKAEKGNYYEAALDDKDYDSEFLSGLENQELSAEQIKAKMDASDAEKAKGQQPQGGAVSNNAVQNTVVNNSRKVVQDPAPHNPDPTGTRLAAVPS